jgi:hypothetical protein
MASTTSFYATEASLKAPKTRVGPKRTKRSKCLISIKAKKNYESLKTGLRHFLANEHSVPGLATAFTAVLNEATACEMEESTDDQDRLARREERKAVEGAAKAPAA